MKTFFKFIAAAFLGTLVPMGFSSCTDMSGDGIDSVVWEGSANPENTMFRNPTWEPSLEAGTVVKGASMYVALSSTTQWTTGLNNLCPALTSNNLMTWSRANDGFTVEGNPSWGEGRVNSLSVDYARAVTGATYWMFYTLEGGSSIGAASATTAQGPYNDRGEFLKAEDVNATSLSDPFFFVVSTNYYLCYTADDGVYVVKLKLNKNSGASLNGTPTKIASTDKSDVALFRKSSSEFYLLATVSNGNGTEIRYAKADNVNGPYLDKSGASMADGSKGELLIESGMTMLNPENPMRVFLNSEQTHAYVAYNATESGNSQMKSGFNRKPLFISPIEFDEEGWFLSSIKAEKGWATPKFE